MSKKKTKKPKDPFQKEGKDLRNQLNEWVDDMEDDKCLIADGFDAAIVGVTNTLEPITVYDWDRCVEILIVRDGMSEEDALEHMSFNVTGAYVGERTPIFIKLFVR
jgi:hypothetical protein